MKNVEYLPKCPWNNFFLSACSLFKKIQTFFLFLEINKNNYKKIFQSRNCLTNIRHIFKEYQMLFRVERGSVGDGFTIQRFTVRDRLIARETATRGVRESFEGWWGPFWSWWKKNIRFSPCSTVTADKRRSWQQFNTGSILMPATFRQLFWF